MLTQGTADIVLDSCDDFWDGKDLRPLGVAERKRAQVSQMFINQLPTQIPANHCFSQ